MVYCIPLVYHDKRNTILNTAASVISIGKVAPKLNSLIRQLQFTLVAKANIAKVNVPRVGKMVSVGLFLLPK